jgi:uncharacterized SAM-binding protein YcdF (DUF218 family)
MRKNIGLWGWIRRLFYFQLIVLSLVAVLFVVWPQPFLRAIGNYLVVSDDVQPVEVLFVLSGGPGERAAEAARLLRGPLRECRAICTGELVPDLLKTVNLAINEGQLTQMALIQQGIDPARTEVYPHGTSTWEEAGHIWDYARAKGLRRIAVVTSALHTRRARWCLERRRQSGDAEVAVFAAPPTNYDLDRWWQSEGGLLFVNNEYVKFCLYTLTY